MDKKDIKNVICYNNDFSFHHSSHIIMGEYLFFFSNKEDMSLEKILNTFQFIHTTKPVYDEKSKMLSFAISNGSIVKLNQHSF